MDIVNRDVFDAGVVKAGVAEGGAWAVVEAGAAGEVTAHNAVGDMPGVEGAMVSISEDGDDGGLHGGGDVHQGGIIRNHEGAAFDKGGADAEGSAVYGEDVVWAV